MQTESARDALCGYLASKQPLLVIDNFEHVLDAAGLVAELLAACPELTLLVTSREALNLAGEHCVQIAPLAVAVVPDRATVAEVAATAATGLFIAAARRRDHQFAASSESAPVIARICARLDGLPLALELAAAHVALLGVAALETRLAQRLSIPDRARDLPDRQRTVRATIQWSYQLLSPGEQTLFRSLAPFIGGARLESVESIWGQEGLDTH